MNTARLVAAYGVEETRGAQVLDASGKGNHDTLANATRSSQGRLGRALPLHGSDSVVTVNDSASLDLTQGPTLSAWVYPTTWASSWKTLIQKERSGGLTYALSANSDAGRPNPTLRIGSYNQQLTAGSHLPSKTWTHLPATYDGATQRRFVDGTQVGSRTQTGNLTVSTNPLRIGGSTVWAGQYFQCLIDEVRIYDRALSQTEIAAVAEEPVSGTTVSALSRTTPCATPCNLWDNTTIPTLAADRDTSAIELGLKFRSDVDGRVTGVPLLQEHPEHWHPRGTAVEQLGAALGPGDLHQQERLGLAAGRLPFTGADQGQYHLCVSYHTGVGRYAVDEGYFNTPYTNGPLRAPSDGEAGGNGVHRYGSGGVFPTSTYRSASYWVDVLFETP